TYLARARLGASTRPSARVFQMSALCNLILSGAVCGCCSFVVNTGLGRTSGAAKGHRQSRQADHAHEKAAAPLAAADEPEDGKKGRNGGPDKPPLGPRVHDSSLPLWAMGDALLGITLYIESGGFDSGTISTQRGPVGRMKKPAYGEGSPNDDGRSRF